MKESMIKKEIAKAKTSEHRRSYFINRVLQGRVILFVIGILIGYTILLNFFSQLSRSVSLSVFFPIVVVIITIFIGLSSIFYSHKIAGPLYRLKNLSTKLAEGDLSTRLKFRKGDDQIFHEVANHFNQMLDDIQKREDKLADSFMELSKGINKLIEEAGNRSLSKEEMLARLMSLKPQKN